MTKQQRFWVFVIAGVGIVLAALILLFAKPAATGDGHGHADEHGHEAEHSDAEHHGEKAGDKHDHAEGHSDHEHHDEAPKAGPHGGELYSEGNFAVELKLIEEGGQARYRAWLYDGGKPLAPTTAKVSATLTRPSGETQEIIFAPAGDALQGAAVVREPHVFDGTLAVQTPKEPFLFTFSKAEGLIRLTDQQLRSAGVTLAQAGPARINTSLQFPGEIKFNQDRTAHVVPRVRGVVEKVHVDLGQQVKQGQVLATIASTELSEQRSALLTAQRRLELARETHNREKKLWEEKVSAEQDYLQARQTMREAEIEVANAREKLKALGVVNNSGPLNRYELRAPFAATVLEKHISLGETLKEDANVFTLSDLSTVWAEMSVPAKDLNRVRVGETVHVRATAFESQATGKISYVGSLVGEQTRAATARVTIQNPNGAWRPGLFVNVEVVADVADVPVAISTDAIQSLDDRSVVFVRVAGGFVPQPVELGRSDGKVVEVRSGLKAGAQYASTGSFVLKSELGKATAEHAH